MGPSETKETLAPGREIARCGGDGGFAPLRGDTSSAPFGGTFPSRGRLGLVRPGHPSPCDLISGKAWRGRRQERKTPAVAEASGRASLRADERRHSPFVRQRRQKAMPARIRGKSQLSIAREGFLDRRSKRCFWLLLSPQTKVARAGARNYPRRRQIMRLRRCATTPHPSRLRRATCLPAGRSADLTGHRRVIQHRGPIKGEGLGVHHSTARSPQGEGLGGAAVGAKNACRG